MLSKIEFKEIDLQLDSNEKCYFKLNDEKTSIEFRSNSKKLCNVVMFTTDPIEKIELFQGQNNLGEIDQLKVKHIVESFRYDETLYRVVNGKVVNDLSKDSVIQILTEMKQFERAQIFKI